jgi:hypothetical protein
MQCLVPDRSSIDWGEGNGSGTVGRGGFHTIDSLAGAGRGNYVRTGTALARGTPTVCTHSSPLAAATAATSTKEEEQEEPAHTHARARAARKPKASSPRNNTSLLGRSSEPQHTHRTDRAEHGQRSHSHPTTNTHQATRNKHDRRRTTNDGRRTTHTPAPPRKRKPPPPPAPKDLSHLIWVPYRTCGVPFASPPMTWQGVRLAIPPYHHHHHHLHFSDWGENAATSPAEGLVGRTH